MGKSSTARYLKRLGLPPGEAFKFNPLPSADLAYVRDSVSAVVDSLPAPELTADQRTDLRGKQVGRAPALLNEVAVGLRRFPRLAAALGARPEDYLEVAQIDQRIGGFIQVMRTLGSAAEVGQLCEGAQGALSHGDADDEVWRERVARLLAAIEAGALTGQRDGQP